MNQSTPSKFSSMPRVIQWTAIAAIGILLFLIWDVYLYNWTQSMDAKADVIENNIREIMTVHQIAVNNASIERLVTAIGPVEFPQSEAISSSALQSVVNSLLQKHGAANPSFSVRTGVLPRTVLEGVATSRLERLNGDLKFEGTPQKAAAIIAELEASPHIEAVTSLRMTKDTGGKVKVNLALEAWVQASTSRTTGALTS